MPQSAAGPRIEPPVSEPIAIRSMPEATAAAEPDDDPPVKWSGFHGLRAGGNGRAKLGPPIANSKVPTLPSRTPPPAASFSCTAQSASGTLSRSKFEWQVVRTPDVA